MAQFKFFEPGLEDSFAPMIDALDALGRENFPATRAAVRRSAALVQDFWVQSIYQNNVAGQGPLLRDPKARVQYARSIMSQKVNDFYYIIGSADHDLQDRVEKGEPARHMIDELEQGKFRNTKYNAAGEPYAVIPFRHAVAKLKQTVRSFLTPKGPKNSNVYAMAKRIQKSEITSVNHADKTRVTKWRGRIASFVEQKSSPRHRNDIHTGMVRFETSTGRGKSSEYMTFRTLSAKNKDRSIDWVIPAREGVPIEELIVKSTEKQVWENLKNGMIEDFSVLGVVKWA